MKLKKILVAVSVLVLTMTVGCTNKETSKDNTFRQDLVMKEVQTKLEESKVLGLQSNAMPVKENFIFESVKDVIEDGFVLQSAMSRVQLQDVFLVKTSDMDAVEKAILKYKDESLKMFGDGYGGEENINAVADSKLVKKDGYVYFIAAPNNDEVEAKLLELIKN